MERTDDVVASPYLTVREAMEYLRCGHTLIYRVIDQLAVRKIGGKTLIRRDSLDAFVEARAFKRNPNHHMSKEARAARAKKIAKRNATLTKERRAKKAPTSAPLKRAA